jgi:hypothetical protein
MLRIRCIFGVLVLLVVLESSCRKRQVAVPLPSAPAPAARTAPTPAPTPAPEPGLEPPPALPAPTEQVPNPAATGTPPYQVNKPPQPPPAAKRPTRSTAGSQPTAPAPAPAPPAPVAPAPQPRLGDILTPDQQRELNAAIDQSLSRAQSSLGSISNRQLSKEQQGTLDQIRNFIQQAQETRKSDLQGAKSLSERAEVLARDLAASFR